MKFLVILCLFATALALPKSPRKPGKAFLEDLRSNSESRIIQGQPASPGQFPHQAFLYTSGSSGQRYVCGGSLISPSWVVTAGHCLDGLTQAEVRLGSVRYADSPVVITSRNVFVHPQYDRNELFNDIALIGLGQDVPVSDLIRPIRILANLDTYLDKVATVSGFGLTVDGGSVSSTLNWVNLRIISNAQCEAYYGLNTILNSTVCGVGIQNPAEGACNGDSGGPMIISDEDGDILIGVVSFGSDAGCAADAPDGFTRPNYFTSWITEVSGIQFS